jgi:hypothetical protein
MPFLHSFPEIERNRGFRTVEMEKIPFDPLSPEEQVNFRTTAEY